MDWYLDWLYQCVICYCSCCWNGVFAIRSRWVPILIIGKFALVSAITIQYFWKRKTSHHRGANDDISGRLRCVYRILNARGRLLSTISVATGASFCSLRRHSFLTSLTLQFLAPFLFMKTSPSCHTTFIVCICYQHSSLDWLPRWWFYKIASPFKQKKSLVLPRLKEAKQKNPTRRSLYDAKMKMHFIMRVSRQQP